MITLGFGYRVDNGHGSWNEKHFCFDVPDMSEEEFEELDQMPDHPDRDEWDDVLDEAICTATTDNCDLIGTGSMWLFTDHNVATSDENLIRGCEILRSYFVSKGMACSAITEYNVDLLLSH